MTFLTTILLGLIMSFLFAVAMLVVKITVACKGPEHPWAQKHIFKQIVWRYAIVILPALSCA